MSDRLARARAVLADLRVDAAVIVNPPNRRYLTGFTAADHGADESAGFLVLSGDEAILLGSPTNTPWARAEALPGMQVVDWTRPGATSILELAEANGWARIGIEDRILPTNVYLDLVAHKGLTIVPIGTAFDDLRSVKSDDEIALIEQAILITDAAFVAAQLQLRAGMTEHDFAEVVRAELRNAGSDGEGFDTIVASGPNAAKPHHVPGDRVIQEGEPVIVDMGARYNGYVGDLTRTIWVGEPSERLTRTYRLVQQAFDAAIAGLRAGLTGRQADSLSRDVFKAAGEESAFVHSLGHGIGLLIHEGPSASQRSDAILRAGEMLTVEPGLYYPDWGGVRIEDSVVITETGVRNLTTSPKFDASAVYTTSGDVL
jgi:Xaa-Pro aminopeptidase